MTKVIKDSSGKVINIGPWNYCPQKVWDVQGAESTVNTNPLPAGAYEDDVATVTGYDGGVYVQGDPRATKPA